MTNLPAQSPDIWKPATEAEKAAALVSLAVLPSRATSSEGLDRAAYYIALEGTTRHGLSEAVKFILRGALGHAFFPSPPELRLQCDKAMEWHEREAERVRRREREVQESQACQPIDRSPAAKARVSRAYAEFCKGYEKAATEETFRLDPELVAQIPDNPKSPVHQRHGAPK